MREPGDDFTRDMGYSAAEFFRVLPAAVRDYNLSVADGKAVITKPGDEQHGQHVQQLTITVTPLPDRQIAMMRLPHVEVRFQFTNFTAAERTRFMRDFDMSYQRGGG